MPRALLAALLALPTLAACNRAAPPAEPAQDQNIIPVTARPASVGTLRAVIHATGILTPAQGSEFIVTAPETARVLEITRAEGEPVASGDVLVRFDIASATANLARQRAELAGAQALVENARASQARTRDFVDRGLIARQDMQRADRELAEAQDALARVQSAFTAAEAAAGRAIVRAPFAGTVSNRLKNPGDVASPGEPVVRVVDPRRMEVTASIPPADIARVITGATARLAGGGAEVVRLTVSAASGSVDARTGNAPVRLAFVEPSTVPVDTAVEIDIDAEQRVNVVFVPAEALVRNGPQPIVFVAAGTTAQRRVVTIGVETDDRVEVTSGVKAGELVITQGQTGLQDGAAITVNIAGM